MAAEQALENSRNVFASDVDGILHDMNEVLRKRGLNNVQIAEMKLSSQNPLHDQKCKWYVGICFPTVICVHVQC